MSRRYQKIHELWPEIRKMLSDGRTHREIEEEFGIEGKQPIHDLLKRERRNEKPRIPPKSKAFGLLFFILNQILMLRTVVS